MAKIKTEIMEVSSLNDVVTLVNRNVDCFTNEIRKLEKRCTMLTILGVFAVGYAIYAIKKCKQQKARLDELSEQVNKMANDQGE